MIIRKTITLRLVLMLTLLSLALQDYLGSADSNFQSVIQARHGDVKVNADQAAFNGKLYFTLNRNLYVLNGADKLHPTQLTHGIQVRDPAPSPDGKWVAFTILHKDYADLAYMPAAGGAPKILISGAGQYVANGNNAPLSTAHWIAEPAWAPDSQHLLFLSDLQKNWDIGVDAFLLDLQLYRIALTTPGAQNAQIVAYSVYGDGGLRDPSYRPGHADQLVYTNYQYDTSGTKQEVQIMLQDANIVQQDLAQNPAAPIYHPGAYGNGNYPSVPLTAGTQNVMNLEPTFSPDGKQLLFVHRDDSTHMSLYSMSVPNGITSNPNNPGFDPQSSANLQQALLPYQHATKLLTGQYLSYPTWSPDGKQIAYINYSNQTFDLWLATITRNSKTGALALTTDSTQQLTMSNSGDFDADSRPAWGP